MVLVGACPQVVGVRLAVPSSFSSRDRSKGVREPYPYNPAMPPVTIVKNWVLQHTRTGHPRGGERDEKAANGGGARMNPERECRRTVIKTGWLHACGGLVLTLAWGSAGAAQVHTNPSATDARAHLAAARSALQTGNVDQARTELQLALKSDPALEEAHVALGTLELQQGNDASAIEQFRRALELNAKSFPAHYNLALAYLRQHKQTEGRQELERAVALDPRHPDANYNLGLVLLEERRPEEAVSHLRLAQAGSPARPDVAFNLVRAQLAANHPDEAEAGSKTFAPDVNWSAAVGRIFFENGRPREAAKYLAAALNLRPDSEEIRQQLAAARLQLQDPAGALVLLQSGDQGAKDAEHHYLLASAYLLSHRLPEAETESREAVSLDPR
jgi:Tfp pilus assembly protein PilF